MRQRYLIFLLVFILVSLHSEKVYSQSDQLRISRLRAVVLARILPSVYWPENFLPPSGRPIRIGVTGKQKDQILPHLQTFMNSLQIKGHSIEVFTIEGEKKLSDSLNQCQVLYIIGDDDSLFRQLADLPILTVGESQDFCQDSLMICLAITRNHLDMVINLKQVRKFNFDISAEVLQHATIIE